jgi:squalene-associated FAD-dependent desaturase
MTLADDRADVVVVGGGLAGISAAIELAEAGLGVMLLEARPWLGGATCSFARRGLTIDNGQHAFIRGCEAYRDLLAKLGVLSSVAIQDRLDLTVLGAASQQQLRRSCLPAPLHLASVLAGYRQLTGAQRVKAAAAALALRLTALRGRAGWHQSFGDWLTQHGQDENARRTFWDLLSVAALGLPSSEADLGLAMAAIRAALAGRQNADIGIPVVPLSRLHASPAVTLLSRLGSRILLGVRASGCQLSRAGGYEIAVAPAAPGDSAGPASSARPRVVHAAAVVLAVPAWEAAALAPAELAADAAAWAMLEPSPVVSLHVFYASPVTSLPFAAVVDSPVRWVMDKSGPAGLRTGQYLAASVPAAGRFVDLPSSRLRAELLPELERLFPAAIDVEIDDFFTTRERRAFIRQVPGVQRLRASQPGLRGLAVAGAWTDTGWPDTMEGAVRSGLGAAWKVLRDVVGSGVANSGADAWSTDVYSTDVHTANVYSANVDRADVHSADIYSTDFRSTDFCSTDVRNGAPAIGFAAGNAATGNAATGNAATGSAAAAGSAATSSDGAGADSAPGGPITSLAPAP